MSDDAIGGHRGHLRYPLVGSGEFAIAGKGPVAVRLLDISVAGTSFRCDVQIAPGTQGQLSVELDAAGTPDALVANVAVQTSVGERCGYRVGARFIGSDVGTQERVARIVAARAALVKGR